MNNIQSIAVNLRTETGRLVPLTGGGVKVVLTSVEVFRLRLWRRTIIIKRPCLISQDITDSGAVASVPRLCLCEKKGIKTYRTESEKNPLLRRGTFDH